MKTPTEKILEYKKLFNKKTVPENPELRLEILSIGRYKKKDKVNWRDVADSVFSVYVRLKNSYKDNGLRYCKCVTCWNKYLRKQIQAWHYRTRSCMKYRFDEFQVYPQCYTCNVIKNGNYRDYKVFMDKTVWPEMEEIYRTDKSLVKYNQIRYEEHILNRFNYIKPILDEMN